MRISQHPAHWTTRWTMIACALVLVAGLAACAPDDDAEMDLERDDMELGTDPYATDTDPFGTGTDPYGRPTGEPLPPVTPAPADPVARPPADAPPAAGEPTAAATSSGVEIFAARCETCHDASEMAGVGQRYDRSALTAFLRGETEIDGETHRRFRGSDEELATLVSWLMEQS